MASVKKKELGRALNKKKKDQEEIISIFLCLVL